MTTRAEVAEGRTLSKYFALPMAGYVVLTDGRGKSYVEDQKYFAAGAKYGDFQTNHVEQTLMGHISAHYGRQLSAIPNGAVIVFYTYWSPCTSCCKDLIPGFVSEIGAYNRGIQVKFRFTYYYTEAEWLKQGHTIRKDTGGSTFWPGTNEADRAYRRMTSDAGSWMYNGNNERTEEMAETTKFVNSLVIARRGAYKPGRW